MSGGSIDERIVEMTFNNSQFESRIKATLDSLAALGKGLKLEGATKGIEDVSAAANKVSLSHISDGVDSLKAKFSAMSIVAITVLSNLTTKALDTGLRLAKSLTIDPAKSGLEEYETNLNAIQTILANTGLTGQAGLNKVNVALQELNTYSDKTIYNFSEMARNIGTFTAAGVDLDTSVKAIKGIANLAAVSGSSSMQASTAMYQLSQALSTGTLKLQDWNSVTAAGMGGKVFQEALKETARVHGVAVDKIIKGQGSFRESLQKGWLTSKILTETLSKFTGDLTAAQLKSMGYNQKQIAEILKMGKTAQDAATKVKTISQLIGTLQEASGSGWARTWQLIFGDFDQARVLFTNVNKVLGGFINASANTRNKVLEDWNALGGRTVIIDAIANAFHAVMAVIKPIHDAFEKIFPPTTGKQLYDFSVTLRDFTKTLKIGGDTASKLGRTFSGVFAALHIGETIVIDVVKLFARLFGAVGDGQSHFLDTTASIGDFLVKLDQTLTKGGKLTNFFTTLGDKLEIPIHLLNQFTAYISALFDKIDFSKIGSGLDIVGAHLGSLSSLGDLVAIAWHAVWLELTDFWHYFVNFASGIAKASGSLGDAFVGLFQGLDFEKILAVINTGLFAGAVLTIRSFVKGILGALGEAQESEGLIDVIKGVFNQLTDTLSAMQNTLRATTLLEIAAALGILTLSVVALSKIDAAGLSRALTAMAVMFTQLFGSMLIFDKVSNSSGFAKMPLVTGAMILLAIAIDILASAVKKLSDLSWEELTKGLLGVSVLILALSASTKLISANSAGMVTASAGLILLATAIKILVSAVTDLSGLSWGDMAKGLIGVGTLLGALTLFTKFAETNGAGIGQGAGLILLAVGIKILASAVADFAAISWEAMAKGLLGVGAALTIVAVAINSMPPSSILSAAALLVVAVSLGLLADALSKFGAMNWENIGKGLVALGGALLIISAAMILMTEALPGAAALIVVAKALEIMAPALGLFGEMPWENIAKAMVVLFGSLLLITAAMIGMTEALPGAAALLVVAAAMAVLQPVLEAFGKMSWEDIAKGLLTLAGALTIIGIAGLLIGPVVPALIGLGVAVALLGVGMLAAGVGVLAFSAGLTALSIAGAAGAAAVIAIVAGLLGLIPLLMKEIGLGVVAFATVIATAGPAITKAITVVLLALNDAIVALTPKIVNTLLSLLTQMLETFANYQPRMIAAGLKILADFLQGIANNIGSVITSATNMVVAFINGISANQGRVVDAGVKMIISFVNGVADSIRSNSAAMGAAGGNLASAIIEGMARGLTSGITVIANRAANLAKTALDTAKAVLGIHSPSKEFEKIGKFVVDGFVKGITSTKDKIRDTFNNLVGLIRDARNAASQDAKDARADITKLTQKQDQYSDSIDAAKTKLAKLQGAKKKDNAAIQAAEANLNKLTNSQKQNNAALTEAKATLTEATLEIKRTDYAGKVLTQGLAGEEKTLEGLADQYDVLTEKIKKATDALDDATKTRDDYQKSLSNELDMLPDATNTANVGSYVADLKSQIKDVQEFSNLIQQLRGQGLDDNLYKDLLDKGTKTLPFLRDLAKQGGGAVRELNDLDATLAAASEALGTAASRSLYQAGVDAAQGLLDGLTSEQKAIETEMNLIAKLMVDTVNAALQIHSPSRVFAQTGSYAGQGLAGGLRASSKYIAAAAESVGTDAILAMSKSISGLADIVGGEFDLNPTITPVIDLSTVQKQAAGLNDILNANPIALGSTYSSATEASRGYDRNVAANDTMAPGAVTQTIEFKQYNNSPKALSAADIYRQTNNQLAIVKGALNNA